jgi:hypothetical protein
MTLRGSFHLFAKPPRMAPNCGYCSLVGHMWTAPWQAFYFGGERLAAFGHMSGLLARTGSAGPDEVRGPSAPDQGGEIWAPDPLRSVRWSSIVAPCRSSRRRRARQALEPAFSFRVRCPRLGSGLGVDGGAEDLAGGDDRPDDPGELVGSRSSTLPTPRLRCASATIRLTSTAKTTEME